MTFAATDKQMWGGMAGTIYGYARVSTDRQDTGSEAQRRALEAAGCAEIIEEQASGRKSRPCLDQLLGRLVSGDVITVCRFDRLSRNVADFYAIGQRIAARGAALRSLAENFDTGTAFGRAMMGFVAVFAQLEAETISERVRLGLAAARARGRLPGRRRALPDHVEAAIVDALDQGVHVRELARLHDVSPATIRRIRQRAALTHPTPPIDISRLA